MRRGTCEFCGLENVEIDAEHVWPTWMGDTLLSRMNKPQLRARRGDETLFETKPGIKALNITAYCACKLKCNSAWMSVLETQLSQFMKPMILDGASTTLNDERQIQLATWCIKTAMVHEFKDREKSRYFTRSEREHVKSWLRPPDDVWIWLSHSLTVSQAHSCPILVRRKNTLVPSMFGTTFAAGHFMFQVFALRRSEWQGVKDFPIDDDNGNFRDGLIRLWPVAHSSPIVWPPRVAVSEDAINAFRQRFFKRIAGDGAYVMEMPRKPQNRH